MKNIKLREYAKTNNVYLWEIALKMNVSEPTITRKFRRELSDEETSKIMHLIKQISKEKTLEG